MKNSPRNTTSKKINDIKSKKMLIMLVSIERAFQLCTIVPTCVVTGKHRVVHCVTQCRLYT